MPDCQCGLDLAIMCRECDVLVCENCLQLHKAEKLIAKLTADNERLRATLQTQLFSERGLPLLLERIPAGVDPPVVTLEAYPKWYGLYIVRPGPHVEFVSFPESKTLTPYIDHVPNPVVIQGWAESAGYNVCELALEMMVGRWRLLVSPQDGEPGTCPA